MDEREYSEYGRFVDAEAVRNLVDEPERVETYDENGEIGSARSDVEESMQFAFHKGITLVGSEGVTKESCGSWFSMGCTNVKDHHDHFGKGGKLVHAEGKVFVKAVKRSCDRYSCPECYRHVAYREAVRAEERLIAGSKKFGLVEHVITSPPLSLHHVIDAGEMKRLSRKVLRGVGFMGGCDSVHGFRYNDFEKRWEWSPHVHNLGWIKGGYGCRKCAKVGFASEHACKGCGDFEDRVRVQYKDHIGVKGRMVKGTGWIVKVAKDRVSGAAEVRRSIRKTISYELAHASLPVGGRSKKLLTWWGCASGRGGLAVSPHQLKEVCPLCGKDLEELEYHGSDAEVLMRFRVGIGGSFYSVLLDGKGVENWTVVPKDRFGRRIV